MFLNPKCTKIYIVMSNTDRTEGRGAEYVFGAAEFLSSATRIAKGNYVQGGDCPIFEQDLICIAGVKYLPINSVPLVVPTSADIEKEKENIEKRKREEHRQNIIRKALDLGLSEDEIVVLLQPPL